MVAAVTNNGLFEADPEIDIEDVAAALAGSRNIADARVTDFIGDRIEDGQWAAWGIKSPEHFLSWQFGVSTSRAKAFTAMAKRRDQLPLTFEKYRSGLLSADQVLLVCRHCPAEYDRSVSEFAVNATLPQLSRSLKSYSWPEPDEPDPHKDWKKQASFHTNDQGEFTLRVTGDAEEGERVRQVLDQYWAKVNDARTETDPEVVSSHEAFMALIDSAADADLSTSRRDRHRALLHIEANDLVSWAKGLLPRLHLGPLIHADMMKLLTCDGAVQLVVTHFGTPIRLGRTSRTIPRWLRDLVLQRDNGCRICGATKGLDVHHITHWVDGGPTDPSNLVTLCSRHHTLLHKGHFSISGDAEQLPGPGQADGLTVTNDAGETFRPPQPRPPDGQPAASYKHPLGERLRPRDVYFCRSDLPGPAKPDAHPRLE